MTETSSLPNSARAVVIGAGIVGNSLAYHLAELGWTELVLLDKGPLPNPGGSTGHASNFIFPVDHSKEMTQLTLDSVRQYEVLGIEVERGRIKGVQTSRGHIATEVIVVCCGVWSPKIARMAGASIPLTPAVHQMIDVGPVPHFKDTKGTIEFP